jgi:hypothetical protein
VRGFTATGLTGTDRTDDGPAGPGTLRAANTGGAVNRPATTASTVPTTTQRTALAITVPVDPLPAR